MAHPAIAPQIHEALDTHRHFTTQVTLDGELRDFVAQPFHVRLGQILDLDGAANAGRITDLLRTSAPNTENRGQRDLGVLVVGNVYPCNAGHAFTPKC